MSLIFNARRMSSPYHNQHEHIVSLRWDRPESNQVNVSSSIAQLVAWLEADPKNKAFVHSGYYLVEVSVVRPKSGPPYLRSHANGYWTDNLLALPLY